MKKWIYIGIGAIVVVIAIIIFGLSNLGPIIKRGARILFPTPISEHKYAW